MALRADIAWNTGLGGALPASLLGLPRLWDMDLRGTAIVATAAALEGGSGGGNRMAPAAALPAGLTFGPSPQPVSPSAPDLYGCSSMAFSQPRLNASTLSALYSPGSPSSQLLCDPDFSGFLGCHCAYPSGATLSLVLEPAVGASSSSLGYACSAPGSGGLSTMEKVGFQLTSEAM